MANTGIPPLSSTVTSIFEQFLKKLEDDKVLGIAARAALAANLHAQKFDPETLRAALFKPEESPK
jgi:hypothetical protein